MDKIDKAVEETQQIRMRQIQAQLATGKPVMLAIPEEFTPMDALCLQRLVLDLYDDLAKKKRGGLVVPSPGNILVPQ